MKTKAFLLFLIVLLAIPALNAQVVFNPQFGFNGTRYTNDPNTLDSDVRIGYQVGADFRFGNRVFLEPGIYWSQMSSKIFDTEDLSNVDPETDLDISQVRIPVTLGAKLINTRPFALRLHTGGYMNVVTQVKENGQVFAREDYKSANYGLRVGMGIDLFFLTFDLEYDHGLSHVFTASDARMRTVTMSMGFKI